MSGAGAWRSYAVTAAAALLGVAIGVWLAGSDAPVVVPEAAAPPGAGAREEPSGSPPVVPEIPETRAAGAPPRVAPHGLVTLESMDFEPDTPVSLVVDLEAALRGEEGNAVKVISTDGRRLDVIARPDSDGDMTMEIAPDFLSPGRYLVEVDVEGTHPLSFRRFVLEVR